MRFRVCRLVCELVDNFSNSNHPLFIDFWCRKWPAKMEGSDSPVEIGGQDRRRRGRLDGEEGHLTAKIGRPKLLQEAFGVGKRP